MKKLFIASLVFSLLLASVSFAETLTINLETSTTDELKTARDAIDKRLAEIRLANAPTIDEAFTISGNGTQILPGINFVRSNKICTKAQIKPPTQNAFT